MKIKIKFMMAITVILILGAVLMMTWIYHSTYRNVLQQAISDDAVLSNAIYESVYGFMRTGQQAYLDDYLEKAIRLKSVNEVRVIRSEALDKELGVKVNSRAKDDLDRQVLLSGRDLDKEVISGQARATRHVTPILIEKSCRSCHANFKEGEVIAALSTTLTFQSSLDRMVQSLIRTAFLQGAIILIVSICIFLLFNRFILKPLKVMGVFVKEVGSGNLKAALGMRLNGKEKMSSLKAEMSPIDCSDEIGELAGGFERMSRDLQKTTVSLEKLNEEVAERQKAEEFIRKSERKFHAIFDQTFQFIGLLTPEGILTDANRTALELSGVKESDALGKPFWETPWWAHSPELQARLRDGIQRAAKGEFIRFEATHLGKGEELHFVDFSLKPVKDENGKVVLLIPEGRDITERKKAEELLRQGEEKLRSITDSAQDAILIMDSKGNISYWNPAAVRILGYAPEEAMGMNLHQLLAPERFHQAHEAAFPEFLRTGNGAVVGKTLELAAIRKDGAEIAISLSLSSLKREDGWHAVGILRDITEQKAFEAEIRRVEVLKTTAEVKSKFASMVSHELRSPLTVIQGSIDLITDGLAGTINEGQKEILEMSRKNAERLGRLINNVLDFQKIESGSMKYDILKNDINETMTEVFKNMSVLSKRKSLDFRMELEEGLPQIKFDRDKLIQVLTNLVSNAIHNTQSGSITLAANRGNGVVHFRVQDTGIGIPAEDLPKLFQPFEQVDGRKNKKRGGTGLGLAISKEIILAHHGKIWAESEIEKGSTFHFTLPI